MNIKITNGTATAAAYTVLKINTKQTKLKTKICPAVILANNRIINEIGFVNTPINSIGAKNNFIDQCMPGIQKICCQ